MVSVDEVISSEKNDTKIRKFGWVVVILKYILWGYVEAQHCFLVDYTWTENIENADVP